nr:DNA-directed DNA polymerase [Tanacetum cinerariifolium]
MRGFWELKGCESSRKGEGERKFVAFWEQLDEKYVNWTQFGKKRGKNTKFYDRAQDLACSSWRRRQDFHLTPSRMKSSDVTVKNALADLGDDTLDHDRNWINNKKEDEVEEVKSFSFYPIMEPIEPLEWKVLKNRLKPSMKEPPKVELKALPDHLEYSLLQGDDQLPVFISSSLSSLKNKLLKVLKSHKKAIAWSIFDIKGIDPSFCTHKILMEEVYKPYLQPQRRFNPNMKEVVKKEVIKLLDAGII